jgi:hypothetical protein
MHPIYLFNDKRKGNIGINADEFETRFISICEKHRLSSRARIFAFILTDFHTMDANHLLLDDNFWNKLHVKSGHFLTIFHFDYSSNEVNKLFREGKTGLVRKQFDKFFDKLSRVFETDQFVNISMPAILFFQTHSAEILDFFCIELNDSDLKKNMDDLNEYIDSAVDSIKDVTNDNLQNSNEIYQLLKTSIDSTKFRRIWTHRLKRAIRLYELIK